ncbi:ATP-dependent DNA ligase, partial [candidate division WOR-3 bacterium]|nr:ATP-dependent DNA ligase [candidate division WOR-3 bacterium]
LEKEPYQAFADQLENYLIAIHRLSDRGKYLKSAILELLAHGYFGIYTNGNRYWFLTAYDLYPADVSVTDSEAQSFWVRKTAIKRSDLIKIKGINLGLEPGVAGEVVGSLDYVPLFDTWSKSLDLNICFTEGGQIVYQQRFPSPKKYPFFIGTDIELLNSFYQKPLISFLTPLLKKYQKSIQNVEDSAKSIANPILTYDADAGIDVNALERALREGYKRIIVGKSSEGKIGFIAPGRLPEYALRMSDVGIEGMMKHLGITGTFLGTVTRGLRERGALNTLMKTTFRKLGSTVAILEKAFSSLDQYLIDYAQSHQMKLSERSDLKNIEQIFQGKIHYVPVEKFKGFGTEDTQEAKNMAVVKWTKKLVPQSQALRELGHSQPRKLIEKQMAEMKSQQEFLIEAKQKAELPVKGFLDEVYDRLKGRLTDKFALVPLADDKVLVKCSEEDQKTAGFLLGDLSEKILLESVKKELPPVEQRDLEVKEEKPVPAEVGVEEKEVIKEKIPVGPPPEETRGRPRKTPEVQALAKAVQKLAKEGASPTPQEVSSHSFSEEELKKLISRSYKIKKPEKYFDLPGLYLVEPHARWIHSGQKTLILKAVKFNIVDKPHLLCGKNFVYGVINVRRIEEDFDIEKTRKFHLVSPAQARKWWKGKKLYLYLFEFHPFENPIPYKRPQGVQTFITKVDVRREMGLPYTGDLKPIGLKPFKLPGPHKPEKKAFQPHEFFKIERLKEMIPEASYDVSAKIDGLLGFLWVADGKVQMYSDVGNRWSDDRLVPILETAKKIFKHDALLQGELVMKGIERKDVAGYIHAKTIPTPEELGALRYIVWDILYIRDKSIANLPFNKRSAVLNLYLSYKPFQKGAILRVYHKTAKDREQIPGVIKQVASNEGAVIRDNNASYWATHSTYKLKYLYDIDAKVIIAEKTKDGLPIFHCTLRDGTYIGQTYAQSQVKAKPGDVIRVNVEHVTIRPDGSVNWYAPRPKSFKEGKITPKRISTTQVGTGGADTLDLIKEIYLAGGGSKEKWTRWLPKYQVYKKEVMEKKIEMLKKKVKAGVPAAKT